MHKTSLFLTDGDSTCSVPVFPTVGLGGKEIRHEETSEACRNQAKVCDNPDESREKKFCKGKHLWRKFRSKVFSLSHRRQN